MAVPTKGCQGLYDHNGFSTSSNLEVRLFHSGPIYAEQSSILDALHKAYLQTC